ADDYSDPRAPARSAARRRFQSLHRADDYSDCSRIMAHGDGRSLRENGVVLVLHTARCERLLYGGRQLGGGGTGKPVRDGCTPIARTPDHVKVFPSGAVRMAASASVYHCHRFGARNLNSIVNWGAASASTHRRYTVVGAGLAEPIASTRPTQASQSA